jgi:hypothetical protein
MASRRLLRFALLASFFAPLLGARPALAEDDKYSAAELKDLVGPVALFPNPVIASLLPATTYPDDLKAASAYVKSKGGTVTEVPTDATWDGSVKTLLQYPDVLTWLNDNPDWVAQMAWAVSVQQSEVLAAIQDFRKAAQEAGNLESNQYQNVVVEDAPDGDTEVIVIESSDPQVIYVPTYDP